MEGWIGFSPSPGRLQEKDVYIELAEALPSIQANHIIRRIKFEIDTLEADGEEGILLLEEEAMHILCRTEKINMMTDLLKETKIGRYVRRFCQHPFQSVRDKAKEIIRCWKVLVDEYIAKEEANQVAIENLVKLEACSKRLKENYSQQNAKKICIIRIPFQPLPNGSRSLRASLRFISSFSSWLLNGSLSKPKFAIDI